VILQESNNKVVEKEKAKGNQLMKNIKDTGSKSPSRENKADQGQIFQRAFSTQICQPIKLRGVGGGEQNLCKPKGYFKQEI